MTQKPNFFAQADHSTEPLKGLAGERRLSRAGGNDGKPVWPAAGPNARRDYPIRDFTRCSAIAVNRISRVIRVLIC